MKGEESKNLKDLSQEYCKSESIGWDRAFVLFFGMVGALILTALGVVVFLISGTLIMITSSIFTAVSSIRDRPALSKENQFD